MPSTATVINRYDVVVVGARCAGAATAMLLARAGVRVLLVDRAEPGTDTLSTHAFMRAGVLQLSRWGLLDALAQRTPAITRTTFDYGSHATAITIRPAAGVSALYAPRRTVLDPLLVDAAVQAGCHVAFGVAISAVRRDQDGRVCGVVGHDRRGVAFRADATLVVGADGLRSTIAGAVDAHVVARGAHASGLWCTYVTGMTNEGYRWFYRPGAAAGLIPTNDGATCVFASMPASRFATAPHGQRWPALLDAFAIAAPNAIDELRGANQVEAVRGWRPVPAIRRRAHGEGWALVGDAGYYKDPLGTHGMTQALRDAQLLTDAIISAQHGSQSLDVALHHYEEIRDDLSAGLFAATDALAGYQWDINTVEQLLRQLASTMSREVEVLSGSLSAPLSGGTR